MMSKLWGPASIVLCSLVIGGIIFSVANVKKSEAIDVIETPTPVVKTDPLPEPDHLDPDQLTELLNEWREEHGYRELAVMQSLCDDIATPRTYEISYDWSHKGFRDLDAANSFGYAEVGENLAKDFYREEDVIIAWEASKGHRENMEYNWKYICIATRLNSAVAIFAK